MKPNQLLLALAVLAISQPVSGQSVQKFNDAVSSGGGRSTAVIGAVTYTVTSSVGEIAAPPVAVNSVIVASGFIPTLAAELPADPADDTAIPDGVADIWEYRYGITTFVPTNDEDKDGLDDLLEAAFNLNPKAPDAARAYHGSVVTQGGQKFLQLVFRRNKWHSAITLVPYRSTGLSANSWTTTGITEVSVTELDAETDEVTVRSTTPITAGSHQFMRLKATYTPPAH